LTYLCVDGGQTKTAVVLMEEGGREVEAWRAGPLTTPSKPGAIANLVPLVASLAQEGDAAATRILDEAAGHLSDIVRALLRRLGDLAVYPCGGVFRAPTMRDRFEKALGGWGNEVEIKDTVNADPLDGVFLVARRGIR
jgi:N-acetylglucosamine kinase-like BadF-type ATPase